MTHGTVRYLQIPAADAEASAAFYTAVFGWQIRKKPDGEISFDDPGGEVSGAWVADRPPSRVAGVLVWLRVDDVDAALRRIVEQGGEIASPSEPQKEGEAIATFRDIAGNLFGVFHEGG